MKKKVSFFITGALLVTAFIFYNSSKNAVQSTISSGKVVGIISMLFSFLNIEFKDGVLVLLVRKSAHIFEFFAQSVMISGSFSGKFSKRIIYILFFGLLTACTDELIQLSSLGRSAEVLDVFIDFSGTVLGMAAFWLIYSIRRKKKCRAR